MKRESSRRRRRRKVASIAALALPLALFLSGCQLNSQFTVMTDGAMAVDIEFHDESGTLTNAGLNCESFAIDRKDFPGDLQGEVLEKMTSRDLACRIHGYAENPVGSGMLKDNGSTYTLTLDPKMVSALKGLPETALSRMRLRLVARMPGKIVDATPGGEVKGNEVIYTDPSVWLSGPVVVEGEKSSGVGIMGWVVGGLVAALGIGFGVSRFMGRKDGELDDGDPDDAVVVSSDQFDSKRDDAQARIEEHVANLAPAKTTESAVNMGPLPPVSSDIEDSESADYSEEIGMVDPQLQGAGADAVQRENVMPPIPAADTQTSPIPGMPPRTPLPDELYAEFGISSPEEKVPAIPSIPNLPPVPEELALPAVPEVEAGDDAASDMPALPPVADADGEAEDDADAAEADADEAGAEAELGDEPEDEPADEPEAEVADEGEEAESEADEAPEAEAVADEAEDVEPEAGEDAEAEAEVAADESESGEDVAESDDESEADAADEPELEAADEGEDSEPEADMDAEAEAEVAGDEAEDVEPEVDEAPEAADSEAAADGSNADEAQEAEAEGNEGVPAEDAADGSKAADDSEAEDEEGDSFLPARVPDFLTNPDDLPDFQTGIPPVFGPM